MATVLETLLLLVAVVAAQNNCSIVPIYVDFHVRAVDGGVNEQYGLFTGAGFPVSQNMSHWPSLSNNETTVASLDYCTNSPFEDCLNHAHGFYSPDLSQNYSSGSSYQSLDSYGSIPATILQTALDTFNLFTHYYDPSPPNITRIPSFPLTVLSNYSASTSPWFGPAGLLGLGPKSTLLDHLYALQLISSRSFGLYMGTAYEQANGVINGSLTLGGYDSGRFQGDVHNFTISPAQSDAEHSPFVVSVGQMTLTASDGTTTDLLTEAFDAHLTTSQYHLNLPSDVTRKFSQQTGATTSNDGLEVFRLPDDFDSTLTITLESGMSVTYESDWLKNVSNDSPISTGSVSNTSTNQTVNFFGTAFLSQLYFIANYDSSPPTFHLANALPHAPYVFTQTLCPNTVPTPAPKSNLSSFGTSGLTGAILGGVVGGIGLSFVIFWLFRKWMQRRMWREQAEQAMKGKGIDSASTITVTAGKGKESPSSFSSASHDEEAQRGGGGGGREFAFDFSSQQHHAYHNFLQSATQQQRQPQQPQQQDHQPANREIQSTAAAHDAVSPISYSSMPVTQYARSFTRDSYSNSPLTPATGVPLLLSQQPTGQLQHSEARPPTADSSFPPSSFPSSTAFAPLTLTHTNLSLEDPTSTYPFGAGQSRGEDDDSFRARQAKLRGREMVLNVQTEFAPPPTRTFRSSSSSSSTDSKAARKAAGKEGRKMESMLKKVFSPPA
ncbi:uncharacterized protein Z520_04879 [Fonsecaea multimorphosa CBS 102226]|uniref:Peptidase A1 domain-containing protein n=1 Tax=Fonsecaea multimorphosa CBS 102226 TaxID=1442371 RepID=A0A0D2KRF9_9EURO|nr:uncharacterized protein Z520_04879 [Fonsecaea multimorphosa CBS 102226]KIX99303.1 hypothetical protein Z520_04879 [Fonsecaea multimorphosa CBS 102226]OAL25829.1 hypothetical protein AYO22_04623 [Fonsecaea multimorphosa]